MIGNASVSIPIKYPNLINTALLKKYIFLKFIRYFDSIYMN